MWNHMQFMKNPTFRIYAKLDRDSQKCYSVHCFWHTPTHFTKIGKKRVKLSDDSFKESILFSCLKKGERIIIIQQHQCEITCNAFTIHIEIEMNLKEWNSARWHIGPYWPKMFINSVGLFIFLLAWLCNAAKIGETDSALGLVFFWIIRGWLERFLWNVFDLKVLT